MTADFFVFGHFDQKTNNGMNWTFTDKHCQPGQQTDLTWCMQHVVRCKQILYLPLMNKP